MKTTTRAVGIILYKDEVLLVKRRNQKHHYFVFPGGGVEENETVEAAVLREIKEETTLNVKIEKLLYHHNYGMQGEQFFYLCKYISGTPHLEEDSIEKQLMANSDDNSWEPLWVKVYELKHMLVYPLEIRDDLLRDIENDFATCPRETKINVRDLRQSL